MLQNLPLPLSAGTTPPLGRAGDARGAAVPHAMGEEALPLVWGQILDSGQDFTL